MMRCLTCLLLALVVAPSAHAETLVIYGDTIHTMDGEAIENGYVLVRDGEIAAVGKADDYRPDGSETVMSAAVVTPGLVDAHTCVGLAGHLNIKHDRDELDSGAPIQPHLRALDAYNPRERLVEWVRGFRCHDRPHWSCT